MAKLFPVSRVSAVQFKEMFCFASDLIQLYQIHFAKQQGFQLQY